MAAEEGLAALVAIEQLEDASATVAGVCRPGEEATEMAVILLIALVAVGVAACPETWHDAEEEMAAETDSPRRFERGLLRRPSEHAAERLDAITLASKRACGGRASLQLGVVDDSLLGHGRARSR
jgi:hypothetical protein